MQSDGSGGGGGAAAAAPANNSSDPNHTQKKSSREDCVSYDAAFLHMYRFFLREQSQQFLCITLHNLNLGKQKQ